jgi:shikimate kinase
VVLATGAGAILDPTNRRLLSERGYVLWLQATVEQQLERLAQDRQRPLLAGGDRAEKLATMTERRSPFYQEIADLVIPGAHEHVHAASARSILLIDHHWQRQHAA